MHHRLDLKIYKIKQFGYYSRYKEAPDLANTTELLNNLRSWISGQPIVENCTYTGEDAPGSEKTLCLSVTKHTGNDDFFLSMWAGVDVGESNAVGAIKRAATPDNIKVEESQFSQDSVPGYPIYFYIMPEHGVIAPVRFDGGQNGMGSLNRYLVGFLERYSKYCQYMVEGDERTVTHHGNAADAELHYYPRFNYRTWHKKDMEEFLTDNRTEITKIIKSDVVLGTRDRSYFTRLFNLGRRDTGSRLDDVKFKYEVDITPTADELGAMIAQKNNASKDSDLDFGFKIGKEVYWLGHSIQKHRFDADIRRSGGILFSAAGTMAFLQSVRSKIVTDLQADQQDEEQEDDGEDG